MLLHKLLATLVLVSQIGTGVIVSYEIDVFDISVDATGAGKPLYTMTIPAAAALCNLAPLPAPVRLTQYNPKDIYWGDPVNVGKICKVTTVLLGTLPVLPAPSNYVLTVTPVDDRGWFGTRSNVSKPFNNTPPLGLSGVDVRH